MERRTPTYSRNPRFEAGDAFGEGDADGITHEITMPGNPVRLWAVMLILLALAGLAIAGPWGVLALYETSAALEKRHHEVALLKEEIAALDNRVRLLDPKAVDSDLVGELARRNLGVLHADEVVITLPESNQRGS